MTYMCWYTTTWRCPYPWLHRPSYACMLCNGIGDFVQVLAVIFSINTVLSYTFLFFILANYFWYISSFYFSTRIFDVYDYYAFIVILFLPLKNQSSTTVPYQTIPSYHIILYIIVILFSFMHTPPSLVSQHFLLCFWLKIMLYIIFSVIV